MNDTMGDRRWGAPTIRELFSQHYKGSWYSFGYPACPNIEDPAKLFELLQPERIGVTLTDEYEMEPEQTTSAIIAHHPQAKYFTIVYNLAPFWRNG